MAALSNPRHERFAQHLAKGHSASEAYEMAGYKPNRQAASRLLSKVDIQGRMQELQDVGAQRAEVTIESHINRLDELSRLAQESGQISAAVRAEELRGKVAGHYVERHEVEQHTTVSADPVEASQEEWESEFSREH